MNENLSKKESILKAAMEFTSKFGLVSLSIGELAKIVGMSKSGLFSHFKSKEKLQIMVLDYAATDFEQKVIIPAISKTRGIERLDAIIHNWKTWISDHLPGGCPFFSAIVEFDDRPGNVQNTLLVLQKKIFSTLERTIEICQEEKQIKENIDKTQMTYEIYSNMIGYHYFDRLLKDINPEERFNTTYQKILASYRA